MSIKKKLLIALSAVLAVAAIVAASVAGTVAYLTASAAVSNTFTVGNVSISMDETKVDLQGKPVDGAARVTSNEYHLVPGTKYMKDPVLHVNTGSENAFLFVLVRNDLTPLGPKGDTKYLKTLEQMERCGWRKYTTVAQGDVYIYAGAYLGNSDVNLNIPETDTTTWNAVFAKRAARENPSYTEPTPTTLATLSKAGVNYKLFEYFYTDHSQTDLTMFGSAQITVTAVAIQAAGFVTVNSAEPQNTVIDADAVAKAWAAVQAAYPRDFGNTVTPGNV